MSTNIKRENTTTFAKPVYDKIEQLIMSGRRTFGQPGASLTWGIQDGDETLEGGEVQVGIEGELATAKVLERWVKTQPNAVIVHSVHWPGSKGDSDHMLAIGNQVFLIDSKRWKSKRKYSISATGNVKRGNNLFEHGKVKMGPAVKAWRAELPSSAKVNSIVCVAQDEVYVTRDNNWRKSFFKLVSLEELPDYLNTFLEEDLPKGANVDYVDLEIVTRLIAVTIKPKEKRSSVINMNATKGI